MACALLASLACAESVPPGADDAAQGRWAAADAAERVRILDDLGAQPPSSLRRLVREALASGDAGVAIAGLRAVAARGLHDADELDGVRGLLAHVDPAVRSAALSLLVAMDDAGAAYEAAEWLARPADGAAQRGEAIAAVRALLAGALPADPAAWSGWIDAERARAAEIAAELAAALRDQDRLRPQHLLRRMAAERNLRGDLVPAVMPLLEAEDPLLAQAAAGALRGLGGPLANLALSRHGQAVLQRAFHVPALAAPVAPVPDGAEADRSGLPWALVASSATLAVLLLAWTIAHRRKPGGEAPRPATAAVRRQPRADGEASDAGTGTRTHRAAATGGGTARITGSARPATERVVNLDRPATTRVVNLDRPATTHPADPDRPATARVVNLDRPATTRVAKAERPGTARMQRPD